jgi:hypothetical protein
VFDRGVGVRELPIEGAHEGEQRGDDRAQAARRWTRWTKCSALPEGTR